MKERAAAEALVDQGVDVIGQHVDTPTVQIVAQERGIYGTGHHRDLREFAPKATLCSSVWVWDKYLDPRAQEDRRPELATESRMAISSRSRTAAPTSPAAAPHVPKDVVDKVMAERQEIIDGKHVYAGPLKDRDGKERVRRRPGHQRRRSVENGLVCSRRDHAEE